MVDLKTFRAIALSFPGAEELPHFDLTSFRVKKRIFATYHEKTNRAMIKFSPEDQSVFCAYDKNIFFPVPGGWGKGGATFVEMKKVRKDMFKDALRVAYETVVKKMKK